MKSELFSAEFEKAYPGLLDEIYAHIENTYDKNYHYFTKDLVQPIDVWDSNDSLITSSRDSAISYLLRYGKKEKNNRKDLLKAIHFIMIMLHKNSIEAKTDEAKKVSY